MTVKTKLTLGWVFAIVALDQVTKLAVDRLMPLHHSLPVIEGFFDLTYIRNTGAAFGIFAGSAAAFRLPFLIFVSLIAIAFVIMMLKRLPEELKGLITAFAFIIGGAIGNLIDRIAYGEVIDFFDVYWGKYHWPAFNIADSFISVGVMIVLYYLVIRKIEDPFSRPVS